VGVGCLAANQLHGVVMNRGRALLWCRRRCLREHDAGVSSPAPRASAGSLGHDASDAQHTTLRTLFLVHPLAKKNTDRRRLSGHARGRLQGGWRRPRAATSGPCAAKQLDRGESSLAVREERPLRSITLSLRVC
jgi:hypothetical protein